jgi:hypothetical protein
VCFIVGVVVCSRVSLFSLLSRFLYLTCIIFSSFSSIVCWIYGHVLPHVLVRDKCRLYIWRFNCCFLIYKYLISSLILKLCALRSVNLAAVEVFGIFILA